MKSYKGKNIDMSTLLEQQSSTLAAGNMRVNARGDIIGRGGKIIKTREQAENEYISRNPNAVKQKSENIAGYNKGLAEYKEQIAMTVQSQESSDPFKATPAVNPNLDTKATVKFTETIKKEPEVTDSLDSLPLDDDQFEISDNPEPLADPAPKRGRGSK